MFSYSYGFSSEVPLLRYVVLNPYITNPPILNGSSFRGKALQLEYLIVLFSDRSRPYASAVLANDIELGVRKGARLATSCLPLVCKLEFFIIDIFL